MGIQIDVVAAYPINDEMKRVLGLAEAVGEPVRVTFLREGRQEAEHTVLVPAATLALWEHWAPTSYPTSEAGDENQAETEKPELAHPAEFGAFTLRQRAGLQGAECRRRREPAAEVRTSFPQARIFPGACVTISLCVAPY